MNTAALLAKAEDFVWRNARLLDRRLFAYHFKNGARDPVVTALRAYLNEDGGFGNALEPDLRCPDSQPVDQEMGLRVLDEVGFEDDIVQDVCAFLTTITTAEGGVPNGLPSMLNYPRAPWWDARGEPPASLNPTAAIAGLLHRHAVEHPWLERATEYCWTEIEGSAIEEVHTFLCVLTFLENVPDEQRAQEAYEPIAKRIIEKGLVAWDPGDQGYVQKPLDWAPTPESICRPLFTDDIIAAHLNALAAQQQDDGGWPISWAPVSPACETEWRGAMTIGALKTLRAYGRLDM